MNIKSEKFIHDHGFVRLLDVMGSDESVESSARMSYGNGTRKVSETRQLLRYLIRHYHTSPLEQAIVQFHVKCPIFVARQWFRHRTWSMNEYSARYSVAHKQCYIPSQKDVGIQSADNKQGTVHGSLSDRYAVLDGHYKYSISTSIDTYELLLDEGVSREQARAVMPVGNYTEFVGSVDLNNFLKFAMLRRKPNAQKEIRDYADACYSMVKEHFPIICEAWEDYVYHGSSFSSREMSAIKHLLGELDITPGYVESQYGLSKREAKEFCEKLGVKL